MATMNRFAVIAEPSRRGLLDVLISGPHSVNDLVSASGMSQPVVSKHLRILRDSGLVHVEPEGQRRLYSINAEPLKELEEWLTPYRA
jgi:DNA-binding transcriptional ArsR family regulator